MMGNIVMVIVINVVTIMHMCQIIGLHALISSGTPSNDK